MFWSMPPSRGQRSLLHDLIVLPFFVGTREDDATLLDIRCRGIFVFQRFALVGAGDGRQSVQVVYAKLPSDVTHK